MVDRIDAVAERARFLKFCPQWLDMLYPHLGYDEEHTWDDSTVQHVVTELVRHLVKMGRIDLATPIDILSYKNSRQAIGLVEQMRKAVEESTAQDAESPVEPDTKAVPPPNGPQRPNLVWFSGKREELQPIPYQLVEYMWSRDTAPISDVCDFIWGDVDQSDAAINAATLRANKALETLGVTWTIGRKSGYICKV